MRIILILILSFGILNTGWAKPNKAKSKTKIKRVVTVTKSAAIHKKSVGKNLAKKKLVKVDKKKTHKKMSEKDRKALARRQVAHARQIASLRQQQNKTPEFKANHEVTIQDYGMEATPPTESEKAIMSATITSEELKLDNNGTTPYIDEQALYVDLED
jgi:FtsZ-interacting cell division protein ZipA